MSEELKPCPFCGGEAEEFHENRIGCSNVSPKQVLLGKEEWNTRPIEDALRSQLAVAKETLSRISEGRTNDNPHWMIAQNALAEIENLAHG